MLFLWEVIAIFMFSVVVDIIVASSITCVACQHNVVVLWEAASSYVVVVVVDVDIVVVVVNVVVVVASSITCFACQHNVVVLWEAASSCVTGGDLPLPTNRAHFCLH